MIVSTEINSDGETSLLKRSTTLDRCGFGASPKPEAQSNNGSRGMVGNLKESKISMI